MNNVLVSAAIAGILGAATLNAPALAADDGAVKGKCLGANGCKGKSACGMPGAHSCHGQNTCKGKGYLNTTKAECDKLIKADKEKKITFEKA